MKLYKEGGVGPCDERKRERERERERERKIGDWSMTYKERV